MSDYKTDGEKELERQLVRLKQDPMNAKKLDNLAKMFVGESAGLKAKKEETIGNSWSPISTAPTDGSRVLVSDGVHVWISSKKSPSYTPKDGLGPGDGWDWYLGEHGRYPHSWQPLPDPHEGGKG